MSENDGLIKDSAVPPLTRLISSAEGRAAITGEGLGVGILPSQVAIRGRRVAAERAGQLGLGQAEFVAHTAAQVALIHACCGILLPLLPSCMMTGFFGANRRFADGLAIAPFAIYAAVAMIVPYLIVANVLRVVAAELSALLRARHIPTTRSAAPTSSAVR